MSIESLELRALQQRIQLHNSAAELKTKIAAARDKLDMSKNAREHFLAASVIACVFGLLSGYGFGGMFTGMKKAA
jgi:hypothetical protein